MTRKSEVNTEGQRRLHQRAALFAGRISGSATRRAERSRDLIRARLRRAAAARID